MQGLLEHHLLSNLIGELLCCGFPRETLKKIIYSGLKEYLNLDFNGSLKTFEQSTWAAIKLLLAMETNIILIKESIPKINEPLDFACTEIMEEWIPGVIFNIHFYAHKLFNIEIHEKKILRKDRIFRGFSDIFNGHLKAKFVLFPFDGYILDNSEWEKQKKNIPPRIKRYFNKLGLNCKVTLATMPETIFLLTSRLIYRGFFLQNKNVYLRTNSFTEDGKQVYFSHDSNQGIMVCTEKIFSDIHTIDIGVLPLVTLWEEK